MKNIILFSLIIFSSSIQATSKYYGQKSTEAYLEFEAQILLQTKSASIPALVNNKTELKFVQTQLENQVGHLIGHFQSMSYLKTFPFAGVLGSSYDFKLKKIETISGSLRQVTYKFKSKINFQKDAFKNNRVIEVPLRLPLNPETIYKQGMVGKINKCTDEHYNSEGDFFYFWDPDMSGCPLKNNSTDVLRISGKLTKLDNTTRTYPEFDRLYQKKNLEISIFLGYIDEDINPSRANVSDDAIITYEQLVDELKAKNFKITEEKKEFKRTDSGNFVKGINFLSGLSKKVKNQLGTEMEVKINILVADTGNNIKDSTFHYYLKQAYEKSDIVGYDGHSGLGGNLSFDTLPQINFTNKYQIYFFNGCSSYPYFNENYLEAKPGHSKNLEIITSGLPTLSSTSYTNMSAFISPFIKGEISSYQALLQRVEDSNESEGTYLMGVNGDEDNRFKP